MKYISIFITSLIVIISVLNIFDLPIEFRFEDPAYNYFFVMSLCVALPLSIFLTAFTLNKRANTILAVAASILLSGPSFVVYFFASSDYESIREHGIDQSFEKINEVMVNDARYRLYRTNGGATTSFGLVLRRETALIKGVNMVRIMFSKYDASEGVLRILDEHRMELTIAPDMQGGKFEIIQLAI